MPTGYEVGLYRDVERVRNAAERLANIETCRYLRERLQSGSPNQDERRSLAKQLAETEGRVIVGPR